MFASQKIKRLVQQFALHASTAISLVCSTIHVAAETTPVRILRVATYNVSLYRDRAGQLVEDLGDGASRPAADVAEVIQRVRPEVILICEFDYDALARGLKLFHDLYLVRSQKSLPEYLEENNTPH